jgi:hypothetical protein
LTKYSSGNAELCALPAMLCDDRYKAVFGVKAPAAVAVFGFN